MKIEQLIVQYLYLSKQVTLQGIGTFKLDPSVSLPVGVELDRNFIIPDNACHFEYDLKAAEDQGLVKFIVQHTRKILPLASSDLDSYAILSKQFLNIGKPLVIEGIGTVQKNQEGRYQFTPGLFITPRIDDIPKQSKENRDESISFESEGKAKSGRSSILMIVITLVLVLAGLGLYYVFVVQKGNTTDPAPGETVAAKTLNTDTIVKAQDTTVRTFDSTGKAVDTSSKNLVGVSDKDTSEFVIVIRNYHSAAAAQKVLGRLNSKHQLEIFKVDSLQYQLVMKFKTPLTDTSRVKDSVRHIFGGTPYIKL